MINPAISIRDLSVSYGEVDALIDASLDLPESKVVGLVGMNGSGKSTLFKAIMGMVKATSGEIRVFGEDPVLARRKGSIAYVPQSEEIDWSFPLSVGDVVLMGRFGKMGPTRRASAQDHAAVEEALARVELSEYSNRQIGQLSGGQRKRAFLARAIAQEAKILLLDEPFAGVDKKSEVTIIRLIKKLANQGVTVLVSTHDLITLPQLADESILLMRRVLMHDTTQKVLQPNNLALAFGIDVLGRGDAT
ncbi:MAG: metal ABC transporter ATP-binding protein [Aquiluna sp.]|nr:metal ABC transporter ATP-binding protein [Aquiluna sp.]